jgi:uncharacterized protein (PEP-CTERM system associated)
MAGRGSAHAVAAIVLATTASTAAAQVWHFEPSLASEFTLTDNVNLVPEDQRKSDFVTQLTPGLRFTEQSARTRFAGTIQAPILFYARTGSENNRVLPEVDILGSAELVERRFFVETAANVSQQYLSPFGAQPRDLSNGTNNRYTAQSYRISPVLKGEARDGLAYELRDNNIWADQNSTTVATGRSYTNEIAGKLTQDPRPLGWGFDYSRIETRFTQQEPLLSELERVSAVYKPDGRVEYSLTSGYESNNFSTQTSSGVIYGGGVKWHASERTSVEASAEHRFFGASYHLSLDHRTPLSVWSLRASRDITTYPQQLASLASGADVSSLLNQLFTSRVGDPTLRQTFVEQFIRERGLPSVLANPLALFSQQVTLDESLQATAGLIGARNTIFGTVFRLRSQPVGGTTNGLPPELFFALNNNTQTGTNLVWTLRMTQLYTLLTSADFVRTIENVSDGDHTRQVILRTQVSASLSPVTDVYAGVRWQRLLSNLGNDYHEAAAFVGLRHVFR